MVGIVYTIAEQDLGQIPFDSTAFVSGPIVVPFKFFPYDHSVFATATADYYVGLNVTNDPFQITPLVAFGMSAVPITKQQNGQATTRAVCRSVSGIVVICL